MLKGALEGSKRVLNDGCFVQGVRWICKYHVLAGEGDVENCRRALLGSTDCHALKSEDGGSMRGVYYLKCLKIG